MRKIEIIVHENRGTFLKLTEETNRPKSEPNKPALNLVLCGRRGAGKTSAAKTILGRTELHSVSNSSECVKNQGEVCGRWVSLVELPALYGKPQETVMEESFSCISLCDPEGVHDFILVLPVGPLTDEDKGELETIQNTFSSIVNDFTMILFTVESDPTDPAVVKSVRENRDIQELCQSCGGRYVVVNIKDRKQISEMLMTVEQMKPDMDNSSSILTRKKHLHMHKRDITAPLLDPLQFAYRANRSVDDAVNMALHFLLQHLDSPGSYARILWITDFLTDRRQFVRLGKHVSDYLLRTDGQD
ncbi:GTPase IMAP family member 8-like [Anabas testudineus]|uniref:GTPase IMAP family member 8-like n=1 Tax=Anabas testudineus TaxID=64144 RepID=UPI000E45BF8F|nr:GTPase IMAP family member 8-like [Anabas testudineus]